MFEQIKYINHLGEVLAFGENGLYVNENELYSFEWDVQSVNDTITGFSKGIQERKIPVRIACATESEGIEKRNALYEIPEKDVLAGQYGKLWVNGYYCDCYIRKGSPSAYSYFNGYMAIELLMVTDRAYWIKESEFIFTRDSAEYGFLDYPYDFPFDYKPQYAKVGINNTSFYKSNFKLTIFGACSNPTLYIDNHRYRVNAIIPEGSYLVINSLDKTITKYDSTGNKVNCFDYRDRDSYIFQMIPPNESKVSWNNDFDFNVVLFEERGAPKWN